MNRRQFNLAGIGIPTTLYSAHKTDVAKVWGIYQDTQSGREPLLLHVMATEELAKDFLSWFYERHPKSEIELVIKSHDVISNKAWK